MLELFTLLAVFALGVFVGRLIPPRGMAGGRPARPERIAETRRARADQDKREVLHRHSSPPLPGQLEGCTFDQIERWMIAQGYYGKTEIAETLARLKTLKSWTPRPMSERQPGFSNDGRHIPSMAKALELHRSKRRYMDDIDESETL